MTRRHITSGSYLETPIGFSRAVRVGNYIAVSGTAPIAPDGKTAYPDNLYEQTKYCLKIIEKSVEAAESSMENVIRTRIMLTDIRQWKEAARAHGEFFSDIKPACTFVEVKGFINPEWLVEIEADCVID